MPLLSNFQLSNISVWVKLTNSGKLQASGDPATRLRLVQSDQSTTSKQSTNWIFNKFRCRGRISCTHQRNFALQMLLANCTLKLHAVPDQRDQCDYRFSGRRMHAIMAILCLNKQTSIIPFPQQSWCLIETPIK